MEKPSRCPSPFLPKRIRTSSTSTSKPKSQDAKKPKPSGAEPATDLPHPQGEVVGPIDTGEGAKYFLYLPKTLKKNQKAPLLFYTNSGGGNKANLNSITEGAELCGWIMAISVESKNQNTIDQNWDSL